MREIKLYQRDLSSIEHCATSFNNDEAERCETRLEKFLRREYPKEAAQKSITIRYHNSRVEAVIDNIRINETIHVQRQENLGMPQPREYSSLARYFLMGLVFNPARDVRAYIVPAKEKRKEERQLDENAHNIVIRLAEKYAPNKVKTIRDILSSLMA